MEAFDNRAPDPHPATFAERECGIPLPQSGRGDWDNSSRSPCEDVVKTPRPTEWGDAGNIRVQQMLPVRGVRVGHGRAIAAEVGTMQIVA
jgi:hypothetical protein